MYILLFACLRCINKVVGGTGFEKGVLFASDSNFQILLLQTYGKFL